MQGHPYEQPLFVFIQPLTHKNHSQGVSHEFGLGFGPGFGLGGYVEVVLQLQDDVVVLVVDVGHADTCVCIPIVQYVVTVNEPPAGQGWPHVVGY